MAFDPEAWLRSIDEEGVPEPPEDPLIGNPDQELARVDRDIAEGEVAPEDPRMGGFDPDAFLSEVEEEQPEGPGIIKRLMADMEPKVGRRRRAPSAAPRPVAPRQAPTLGPYTTPEPKPDLPTGAGFIAKETAKEIGRRTFVPLAKGGVEQSRRLAD